MAEAFLGMVISAMATGLGAIPVLFLNNVSSRVKSLLLGYASGIMMAATTFSLIPESLKASNIWVLSVGMLLGTFVLNFINSKSEDLDTSDIKFLSGVDRKTLLIVTAITLHNLPEGLSVGVSYGSGEDNLGAIIAFAIGLQNAPEGFLVGIYLIHQNMSKLKSLLIATFTGAVEIVTAVIGYFLAADVDGLVPYGLSFAAGAMLFVIYKELIPESQEKHIKFPTYSFILGLISMLYLTIKFG
ncbi:ZIP family metal transporter [Mesobacillus sp. AQ2]|jgi:zinc transporter, ZIP family|uniref:ZIP family metal transporter n=1 Tax=Bacillaceae TaxID=186817 RepID=UPI00119DCB5B|nr:MULTISPECIES: ZIP family metal transporter [Bacillaceae]MCM3121826.1 ZIP family metal transporter [Mesobacillus sp. MER 33]MCM3231790.1 ZIP family metal transporter [Mesobacillus sp. MER 48]WHX42958.1 ZIP family metal transporter [Mesobacillus sp. AQ2]